MVMRGRKLKRHGREVVAQTMIMCRDQGKVKLTRNVSVKCQSTLTDMIAKRNDVA